MKKRLLVVAFFATALFAAVNVGLAHTAQPLDFHKSFSVTIPEGFVDGTLENFPLLVRLSEGGINGFLYSEYEEGYEEDGNTYDHKDAAGFIKLNALRLRVLARSKQKRY